MVTIHTKEYNLLKRYYLLKQELKKFNKVAFERINNLIKQNKYQKNIKIISREKIFLSESETLTRLLNVSYRMRELLLPAGSLYW